MSDARNPGPALPGNVAAAAPKPVLSVFDGVMIIVGIIIGGGIFSFPPLVAGMTFQVSAGCDKSHRTCRAKFSNIANFRGFPHMPGNDFALTYARRGDDNDGKPVVA